MAAAITSRRVHDQDFAWYDHYDDLFERYIDSSPVGSSENTADPSGSEEDGRFFDTSAAAHEFSLEARGLVSHDTRALSPTWYQNPASAKHLQHSSSPDFGSKAQTTGSSYKDVLKKLQRSTSPSKTHPTLRKSKSLWIQRIGSSASKLALPFGYGKEPVSPPPSASMLSSDHFMPYPNMASHEQPRSHVSQSYMNDQSHFTDPFNQPYHHHHRTFTPVASPQEELEQPFFSPRGTNSYMHHNSYSPPIDGGMISPHSEQPFLWEDPGGLRSPSDAAAGLQDSMPVLDTLYQPISGNVFQTRELYPADSSALLYQGILPAAVYNGQNGLTTSFDDFLCANAPPLNTGQPYMAAYTEQFRDTSTSFAATTADTNATITAMSGPIRTHLRQKPSYSSLNVISPSQGSRISRRPSRQALAQRRSKASLAPSGTSMDKFVNFTPKDRRVILDGVAPSGSSKTKERREKEAREKLVRAVREAGGNVASLEREG